MLFFEPKGLYRIAEEDVPDEYFEVPLGKAEVLQEGSDLTIVAYGAQVRQVRMAAALAAESGINCEVIDLRTVLPWDVDCVAESVRKTGKLLVTHEAPVTCGFAAEVSSAIQEHCFLSLESPIKRVCGYDTPFPGALEPFYVPNKFKILQAIKETVNFYTSSPYHNLK